MDIGMIQCHQDACRERTLSHFEIAAGELAQFSSPSSGHDHQINR
jgi:hypothetical protein